jgi:hypothetical protein
VTTCLMWPYFTVLLKWSHKTGLTAPAPWHIESQRPYELLGSHWVIVSRLSSTSALTFQILIISSVLSCNRPLLFILLILVEYLLSVIISVYNFFSWLQEWCLLCPHWVLILPKTYSLLAFLVFNWLKLKTL